MTALALSVLAARLFWAYLQRPDLDHKLHVVAAQRLVAAGVLLPHFGYHLLVAAGSGFSAELVRLEAAACVVLTLLVLAKLALALGLLRRLGARAGIPLGPGSALALGVALFFAAPLPNWWRPDDIYLGQLSPTVWHNPTVIALLPLAVASFWAFVRMEPRPRRRDELLTGLLLCLSALTKPNFALAFLPAALLLRLRRGLDVRGLALLFGPTAGVLAWQYSHALASRIEPAGGGIATLRPLAVWSYFSPHPLVSILLSLAFPLAVTLVTARRARHGYALAAAWLVTLVALAQFVLLAEPEPRLGDANYYWGIVPSVFLLFVVCASELLAAPPATPAAAAVRRACWALLLLHVASGVFLYCHPFQLAVVF